MINYSCLIMMIFYFFTCTVVIYSFLIGTSTWLYISFSLKSNEFIWWTFGMNIAMRKVWISYDIITVLCMLIIWLANVDVWGNSITSPLLRNVKNIPFLFPYWRRKWHYNLFYFFNELSQYNHNEIWNLRRRSMSFTLIVNRTCDKYKDWLNGL